MIDFERFVNKLSERKSKRVFYIGFAFQISVLLWSTAERTHRSQCKHNVGFRFSHLSSGNPAKEKL